MKKKLDDIDKKLEFEDEPYKAQEEEKKNLQK